MSKGVTCLFLLLLCWSGSLFWAVVCCVVRTVAIVANVFEFATSVVALTPIEFTARLIGAAVWVRVGGCKGL